jgi:hypothetical protein
MFMGQFGNEDLCTVFEYVQSLARGFPINRCECLNHPVVSEDDVVAELRTAGRLL